PNRRQSDAARFRRLRRKPGTRRTLLAAHIGGRNPQHPPHARRIRNKKERPEMTGIHIIRLGWTLLHFLWQGTAIAIAYAAIRFLFARTLSAGARYTLACAALLAMAIAPVLTFLALSNDLPTHAPL